MFPVIILICMAGCALAICPNFDTVSGLDLAKQINTWQIHGILRPRQRMEKLECLSIAITGENLGVEPVRLKAHAHGKNLGTGKTIMVNATVTVASRHKEGAPFHTKELLSLGPSSTLITWNSVIFALCSDSAGPTDLLDVLFVSRLHNPISNSTRDNFLYKLKSEYSVDPTNYVSIYHDHHKCGH